MKFTLRTTDNGLTAAQKQLAQRLGISEVFLKLLLGRGIEEERIADYLHPSANRLSSPFDIAGMSAAKERIEQAIRRGQKLLIYGDYDCDGICAISILMLYLRDKADVKFFIPDRTRDGYGISVGALERIISARRPDLVITVDCGITAVKEVEYLVEKGIDVIVTDHHEPQEILPACTVVDAKIQRKGFYELCGAGVALKLVEVLGGRDEALKYVDIAAIATIADVVPLVDDNRIIASLGLKRISTSPRKGIKLLLGDDKATSQDVMFRLAPRMNAAGRLGSAMKVVGLFLEDDYFMLKTLSEELARDNAKRQDMCEAAVEQAKAMLRGEDFSKLGVIALYGEDWEPGIIGIAAARLAEEFKRPAILFAKNGDELKGSARSVPAVDIFALLTKLSRYFTGFGGHRQAAGVTMTADNFEDFKRAANEEVLSKCTASDFLPDVTVEMSLPLDADFLALAKELELMQPTGYQNPQPNFLLDGSGLNFERVGLSNHVKCQLKGLSIMGFSRYADALSFAPKSAQLEVNLGLNCFQNNVTAQATLRSVNISEADIGQNAAVMLMLHQLSYEGECKLEKIDKAELEKHIAQPLGTALLCFCQEDVERLEWELPQVRDLPLYVGAPPCLNPETAVILCPSAAFDPSFYNRAVVAGSALCDGYLAHLASLCPLYAYGDVEARQPYVRDDLLRSVYRELAGLSKRRERVQSMHKLFVAVASRVKVTEPTFEIAMKIFEELRIVSISDRGLLETSNKRVELASSAVYRNTLH